MTVVGGFEFGGRDVSAGFVEPPVVEPVHVLESGDFHLLGGMPGPAWLDQLGFEQADDRLGQGVIVGVADGPDGGLPAHTGRAEPAFVATLFGDNQRVEPPVMAMESSSLPPAEDPCDR